MGGFRYEVITEYWPLFMEGAKMTIQITIICVVLGVILGMALGMARLADARHAPWRQILKYCVRWPVTVYVSFFRGTPLFVQILLMQFAILPFFIHPTEGLLISGDLAREIRSTYGAMLTGIIAITLNAGAYLSEVFRAGIQSLDKGQMEAARSVGMTYWQAMFHIPSAGFPPHASAFGQQRDRHPERLLAGVRNRSCRTCLRCANSRRRIGSLLGAVHHHLSHVLGHDTCLGLSR